MDARRDVGGSAPAARVGLSPRLGRVPLLALGGIALVSGVLGGLGRAGWDLGVPPTPTAFHGALMIAAFFATLIGLERAVALGRGWAYLAPALAGAGGLALLGGLDARLAAGLATGGAAVMLAAQIAVVRIQAASFTVTMAVGAAMLLLGDVAFLLGRPAVEAVVPWAAFLLLTIAGERLELSRLVRTGPAARAAFQLLAAAVVAACALVAFEAGLALRLFGAALAGLALWLARNDVARRTVRAHGLPRYIAVCLLAGYAWLAAAGVFLLAAAPPGAGLAWDGALHALFVGFVLSMVFGHAPIILPAVVGLRLRHGWWWYAPLTALHATLVVRVGADLAGSFEGRAAGALGNALALALFLVTVLTSIRRRERG